MGAQIGWGIRHSDRTLNVPKMLKEPGAIRTFFQPAVLLSGETGGNEDIGLTGLVEDGNTAESGTGQSTGAFHYLVKDGIQVEARADAKAGFA